MKELDSPCMELTREIISDYLRAIEKQFRTGEASEHSYRGMLQNLFAAAFPKFTLVNEPTRQACGAPDFVLRKHDIPVGYIEAKDLGASLDVAEKSEQLKVRYIPALNNLILTNYLEFRFYRNGKKVAAINLGAVEGKRIVPVETCFEEFSRLIVEFTEFKGITIKTASVLAVKMAAKAALMKSFFFTMLQNDRTDNNPLHAQLKAFQSYLIHDLDEETFSDIYAQTIAYGMFTARINDQTTDTFSKVEAAVLIPKTNPFLRNLFGVIAAVDLDERIAWVVEELVDLFRAVDVPNLLSDFERTSGGHDPFIHFYETFLAAYDPKLKKTRGVYYTPEPAVQFIVRAVDEILREHFNLHAGLADASKISKKVLVEGTATRRGKKIYEEREFHRVQVLDPATGTGTFLAEVVRSIYRNFENQQGRWPEYVRENLIPRLTGFEILLAPYAVCHLKLELLLRQLGIEMSSLKHRLNVFLTNSLEEADPNTGTLFASWLSAEAREANRVKKDVPVMVVLGNPPYAISSSNKSEWIRNLLGVYKKNLQERNIQPLSDDYIKFIRLGNHYIDKSGEGILAYISNNSFIDGLIHRQMRKTLLESFNEVYILDLHGSTKKKETSPDGSVDENVFDIQQGVSINIFVKDKKMKPGTLGQVFFAELFGSRTQKYDFLRKTSFSKLKWEKLTPKEPDFYFVPKDFSKKRQYEKGFQVKELFRVSASGIKTQKDNASIFFSTQERAKMLSDFNELSSDELMFKYRFQNVRDWNILAAKKDVASSQIILPKISYRPFDERVCIYTGTTKGIMGYPRFNLMRHLLAGKNVGLALMRSLVNAKTLSTVMLTENLIDLNFYGFQTYLFPLYLYAEGNELDIRGNDRTPNLNAEIIAQIASGLGLEFVCEPTKKAGTFAPIDLLDYIYAVLYTPKYREEYNEFLRVDFPRVPLPKDVALFWKQVHLGRELRLLHLMESPKLNTLITGFPMAGSHSVEKISYKNRCVFINSEEYFSDVPEEVWNFFVGGYQPAQRWLKERKGRKLSDSEIEYYQKVVVALVETLRIMRQLDSCFES